MDFVYKFRFTTRIRALELVPSVVPQINFQNSASAGRGPGGVRTRLQTQDATISAVSASCWHFFIFLGLRRIR